MFCGFFLSVCGFVLLSTECFCPFSSVYFVMEAENFELLVAGFSYLIELVFYLELTLFRFLRAAGGGGGGGGGGGLFQCYAKTYLGISFVKGFYGMDLRQ